MSIGKASERRSPVEMNEVDCAIHGDAPNPNCPVCKRAIVHPAVLLTESARINRVRELLQEKAAKGLLGMIAARANVAEGKLYLWTQDPAKVPNWAELMDIQRALNVEVILDG